MIASLSLAFILAVAPGVSPVASSPVPRATTPADPCDAIGSLADGDCSDVPLCSRRQRVQIACELRNAMERRYVFYQVKGALLGPGQGTTFDARTQLDACVAAERAISAEDDPLHFYDRMRRCVSAFADGHLMLSVPARLPQVATGIGLRRLGNGQIVIANRERKVVAYLRTIPGQADLDRILAVGNEVVGIDGAPAAQALSGLAAYLPGSSDAARLERAADAITRRDFAFPARRTLSLTVVTPNGKRSVELPWWASPDARSNILATSWLQRTGISTTDLLAWQYDKGKDVWDRDPGAFEGALRSESILPPPDAAGLRRYLGDGDRLAVRSGEVEARGHGAYCYLQILTFHTESLRSSEGRQSFLSVIEGFLQGCKEQNLDLMLDLRQNDGGYLSHSSALFAMLGEHQKAYPAGALLLRANTLNQLVFQQRVAALGGAPAHGSDDALEPHHIAEAIGAARKARQEFAPAFLERPLHSSEASGGFDGRVVALVAPTCMSACDRLAALLESTHRATLVGMPTEGAGGSQQETRDLSARWTDSEALISLSIPNAAMGVQHVLPANRDQGASISPADFFASMAFENRPVMPDVPYRTKREDITGHNQGWRAEAEDQLFGPSGVEAQPPAR